MQSKSGLVRWVALVAVFGAAVAYVFAAKKQEQRYDEILVRLHEGQRASAVRKLAREHGFKVRERKFAVGPNAWTRKNRVLSIYKYDLDPARVNRVIAALGALRGPTGVVASVEPNFRVRAFDAPNDPLYAKQWNLRRMRVEDLWKKADGKDVVVAVIDTGVSTKLADLDPKRLVKGFNFITRDDKFEDDHGHGSHVAGTIAQDTNNGIGVAGIAPKARIMPLKVLGREGGGSTLDIAEAIVYAADNGAHIINLSLGGGGYTQVLEEACAYAQSKGAIVIAAAGNEGQPTSSFPARYPSVISVAASGPQDELAPYSNHGQGVDVIAPGGNTSGAPEGGILQNGPAFLADSKQHEVSKGAHFFYFQGTSMAAPHVAGVAALLHQAGVKDPQKLRALLLGTAEKSVSGLPFVTPMSALERMKEPMPTPPPKPGVRGAEGQAQAYRFDAGVVAATPQHAGIVLGVALLGFFAFALLRRKTHTMESVVSPLMLVGLVLGATGLSFLGFLQTQAPFNVLPERFAGLLFNSALDFDRVLFFLNEPSPFWHNFLVPALFMVLLNFADEGKRRFTIGLMLGFAAKLVCEGLLVREIAVLPDGFVAAAFLVANGLIVFMFPFILAKR